MKTILRSIKENVEFFIGTVITAIITKDLSTFSIMYKDRKEIMEAIRWGKEHPHATLDEIEEFAEYLTEKEVGL